MIPAPSALADSLLNDPARGWRLSPRIRVTHVKLFADGALGSRGAALTHPYADDVHTRGVPRMTRDTIVSLARRALDGGLGVATHAIGDEAVRRTLDAYEQIVRDRPNVARRRLRIEHFSYATDEDLARAARLGIVLSIQSGFNSAMDESPPFGTTRVGQLNEPRVYPWSRLRSLGATLAEGSDYFSRPGQPLASFAAALSRRHGAASEERDPGARISAYRLQSGWISPEGDMSEPRLAVGAAADFVILSANPLTVSRSEIAAIAVLATVHNGALTWTAPAFRHRLPRGLDASSP